ncbi:MAG: aldo/keto reductase [Pirellula sp.]|nr:aldo/keto reductase [Pirellula sp.]
MKYRKLGRTPWNVSEISFGAWAIGGSWGAVDDQQSMATLHHALDLGINFFDTADVYGDGHSERLLAQLKRERPDSEIIIATKAGRRLPSQTVDGYSKTNLQAWLDRSRKNLECDTIDLVQLHCPPTDLYYTPQVFDWLEDFVNAGVIKYYGVSVEKVEQAIKAIEYPHLQTVQIIFNLFRQRPAELFFQLALQRQVGILARVPLASGLLTGRLSRTSSFAADDHRNFNRYGQQFDQGETFSGVDFELALEAVEELSELTSSEMSLSQLALKWILMHPAVSCAIPGARRPSQIDETARASDLNELPKSTMEKVADLYNKKIRPSVHHRW